MRSTASHFFVRLLSFFVVSRQWLRLPPELDGHIWRYNSQASANRRHTHAELELNLVTRGHGIYFLGQRRYQIRRGDLLWLFPAQDHVLIEQSDDFEMWIAVFRRRAIRRCATDAFAQALLRNNLGGDACRRLGSASLARLHHLFAQLAAATKEPGFMNVGLAYSLLESWRCFADANEVPVRNVHPAVERAARIIRDTTEPISLAEVAHRAGLSAARLSRLFKQQTGFPMVDFRNRQRLDRFLERYGSGQQRTLLDAALDAGFGSYPQFHRIFTRLMGCSPATYRDQRSQT
ncbi:MAG TPA: helix-turn-helix domain-containing protein [Acidobacteriaceae bacterium]|jgi:AraC-like DNA-binding protein|nr:helix-turn-helix domain-containing protein [Acidobacteriaceae bacterium]